MINRTPNRIALAAVTLALLAGCGRTGATAPIGRSVDAATAQAKAAAVREGLPPLSESDPDPGVEPIVAPPRANVPAPGVTHGNAAVLSVGTGQTVPAIKAMITGAQRTLWIEIFEFGGTFGDALVPLVLERAKAGVKVRILFDQLGSGGKTKGVKNHLKALNAAGVDVRFYPARLRRDGANFRFNITHRKLILADEDVAMTGGTNMGTTFDTTTHDLMVKWRGPVVSDLYREFTREWKFVGGGVLPVPYATAPAGDLDAQVAVTSVHEGRYEIRDAVYKRIEGAQTEIVVEQQYVWEDGLERRLAAAAKRGVKVRVLVPGGTAEQPVLAALNNEALRKMVAAGVEARAYRDPQLPVAHLHAKYFSVDDRWVATGSCNGDARSMVDHQELDVLSTTPAFVREVRERLFEADWNRAGQPWVYRKLAWYERPLRGLMELVDYLF